jgi:hypothetical protein
VIKDPQEAREVISRITEEISGDMSPEAEETVLVAAVEVLLVTLVGIWDELKQLREIQGEVYK